MIHRQHSQIFYTVFCKRGAALGLMLRFFLAGMILAVFIPTSPADAWVAGYFHLRHTAHDPFDGQALRAMDVLDSEGKVSGFIELTGTTFARDSQLWEVLFPRNGTIGFVKFKNKLTGQCIGEDETGRIVLRPCSDGSVIWNVISMAGNRLAIQKIQHLTQPFRDIRVCLTKETTKALASKVLEETCNSGPDSSQIWEAYVSG